MPKTLWKIKEFKDYKNRLKSMSPPKYDMDRVNQLHKDLDIKIREYWDEIHPFLQDYIYSFSFHWTNSEITLRNIDREFKKQSKFLENLKASASQKINELMKEIKRKNQEILKKDHLYKALEGKLAKGESEMGELVKEFDTKLKEYEETHYEVGKSFQFKIMNMEADLSSKEEENQTLKKYNKELSEKLLEKDNKIQELQSSINKLKRNSENNEEKE